MPVVYRVIVLSYVDTRHRPRGPKAQKSQLVLMMTPLTQWVGFVNEKGSKHGPYGSWSVDSGLLIITFSCLGGCLREATRWYASGPSELKCHDIQTATMTCEYTVQYCRARCARMLTAARSTVSRAERVEDDGLRGSTS